MQSRTTDERHPARAATQPDFAATLRDGRRVVGRESDGEWSIYVYPAGGRGRMLGFGSARSRRQALEEAGLSGDDAAGVPGGVDASALSEPSHPKA